MFLKYTPPSSPVIQTVVLDVLTFSSRNLNRSITHTHGLVKILKEKERREREREREREKERERERERERI